MNQSLTNTLADVVDFVDETGITESLPMRLRELLSCEDCNGTSILTYMWPDLPTCETIAMWTTNLQRCRFSPFLFLVQPSEDGYGVVMFYTESVVREHFLLHWNAMHCVYDARQGDEWPDLRYICDPRPLDIVPIVEIKNRSGLIMYNRSRSGAPNISRQYTIHYGELEKSFMYGKPFLYGM